MARGRQGEALRAARDVMRLAPNNRVVRKTFFTASASAHPFLRPWIMLGSPLQGLKREALFAHPVRALMSLWPVGAPVLTILDSPLRVRSLWLLVFPAVFIAYRTVAARWFIRLINSEG